MLFAKIYRPSKSAMQSGRAKSQHWLLEFEPSQARRPDPLMGWAQGGDTRRQIHLKFDTKEEAIAYAQKYGIPFQVRDARETPRKIKPYAGNFSFDRKVPWSH